MKNTLTKITIALATTLALSSPVLAANDVVSPVTTKESAKSHVQHHREGHREHKKMENKGAHFFIQADLDKDGSLSRQEMLAQTSAYFDKVDTNQNGQVTKEELREFHQKMRAQHSKHLSSHVKPGSDVKNDNTYPMK